MEIQSASMIGDSSLRAPGALASELAARVRSPDVSPVVSPVGPEAAGTTAAAPTHEAIKTALDRANTVLESKTVSDLQFSIDQDTQLDVVKLVDRESGEVLLQFPSAEILKIAKTIDQYVGAIVAKTA